MKQLNQRLPMRSAKAAGRSAQRREAYLQLALLGLFSSYWLSLEEMRYTDSERQRRGRRFLQKTLGGPAGFGLLQSRLNEEMDNVLSRLQTEFPHFRPIDILVFSWSAAGFPRSVIRSLSGLRDEGAVSVIQFRMRFRITASTSPNKEEYLALLPRKGCRFGKDLLYLRNL